MKKLVLSLVFCSVSCAYADDFGLDRAAVKSVEGSILKLGPAVESLSQDLSLSLQKLSEVCEAHSRKVMEFYEENQREFHKEMKEFQELMNNGSIRNIRLLYLEKESGNVWNWDFLQAVGEFFEDSRVKTRMREMIKRGYVFSMNALPVPKGVTVDESLWNGWVDYHDGGSYQPNILINKPITLPQEEAFQEGLAFEARWRIGAHNFEVLSSSFPSRDAYAKRQHNYSMRGSEDFVSKSCQNSLFYGLKKSAGELNTLKEQIAERARQSSGNQSKTGSSESPSSAGERDAAAALRK